MRIIIDYIKVINNDNHFQLEGENSENIYWLCKYVR